MGRVGSADRAGGLRPEPASPSRPEALIPSRVFRVQDREGRGPYRPGFSARWRDKICPRHPPAWWSELGLDFFTAHKRIDPVLHSGCAFQSVALANEWFSPSEQRRLDGLGYRLVIFEPDVVFFETPSQIVIGMRAPLSSLRQSVRLRSGAMEALAA